MDRKVKLKVDHVSKVFFSKKSEVLAVDDVSLSVYENEFLVLLGPGQAGKTVLLNMIAGLLPPTAGTIEVDGEPIKGPNPKLSVVFQKIAVMPWKTTLQNVEMGLKYAHVPKEERHEIAKKYIELVGLKGFEDCYPRQLSGGMKQRVGIARAYAANPEILLMDEPFGALDAQTRYSMQDEILKIWEKDKRTVIFVTNNIEEAVYLGDRIVLFSERPAKVKEVYSLEHLKRPRNYMDRDFLETRELIESNTDLSLR